MPNARSDDRWRHGRRMLDRGLRPGAITPYRPVLQARMNLLLSRLLAKPHQWEAHFELSVTLSFDPAPHFVPEPT
jgi:cytochrome P450